MTLAVGYTAGVIVPPGADRPDDMSGVIRDCLG